MSSVAKITTRLSKSPVQEASGHMAEALSQLRRRVLALGAAAALGWCVVVALVILLVFAWADLVLELPPAIRLSCGMLAIAAALIVVARNMLGAGKDSTPLAIARRLDEVAQTHGQIRAGVDLANSRETDSPLSNGLTQLAVRQAFDSMRGIEGSAAFPRRALFKPVSLLLVTLLVLTSVAIVSPRLFAVQWARFTDPFGDHPPYSQLTFDVDPGDARVVYGGSIDVRAVVHGGVPDRMELLFAGDPASTDALPMFPEGDGKWRATLVNITTPQRYLLRAGRARTRQYSLDVITVPKLTDLRFHVQLPAYTNRPPYDGPLPPNGLAGLPGTFVEVHATSNRPLRAGMITFTPLATPTTAPSTLTSNDIDMIPAAPDSNEVVGRFVIQASGRIAIGVTDVAGQPSTETQTASVTLLSDERPFVRIIEPKTNSFATPDALIKVDALAEDDYGISKVSIYRGLNDTRPLPTDVPVPLPPPTQFPASLEMHLSDYGLSPGDVIQLFARALDNDPAGAKGSDSSVVTIRVVSQADMDRMLVAREGMEALQSKYASAERRIEAIDSQLDKLEKELSKLDPNSKPAEALRTCVRSPFILVSNDEASG